MLLRTMPEPEMPPVELARCPSVYPRRVSEWAINLLPAAGGGTLTIAPFETERDAHEWIAHTFGEMAHARWFPELYEQAHQTCPLCTRYRATVAFVDGRCPLCHQAIAQHVAEASKALALEASVSLALATQYSSF